MDRGPLMKAVLRGEDGFTLAELLTVVAIVGILAIAFGASFIGWREQYNAESDMKKLHGALMEAKLNAVKENRFFFVYFPPSIPNVLRLYRDTDPTPKGNGLLDLAKDEKFGPDIEFTYKVEVLADFANDSFWFTAQGWVGHEDYDTAGERDFSIRMMKWEDDEPAEADYNCLSVSPPLYFSGGIWNSGTSECMIK